VKRTREQQIRREWIRSRILTDSWAIGYPRWPLFGRIASWFAENRISFGIFMSGPVGRQDDPIGLRVGFLTADSPRRILIVGWARLNRTDLDRLAKDGRAIRVRVFGWLRISEDVDAALATRTLKAVKVIGVSRLPASVRSFVAA
jgi:hypothetical protein